MKNPLIIVFLAGALASCDFVIGDEDRGREVARVYDVILYQEDLAEVLPAGLSEEDSVIWAQNYINNWGKEQLIIRKAEFNLADREKDFQELVDQYRSDLLKFTYQQRYVNEHLDTVITDEQIVEYYADHQSEFELKENILKVDFMVVGPDAPELDQVRSWFRSSEEEDRLSLEDYAFRYARISGFADTGWVRYNDVARLIPLKTYNQQEFLSHNSFVEISDSAGIYFLNILDYKIADDVSPLPYVHETIRNIILNKRKQELIASMEERIVNDAYEKNDFEIY